MDESDWLSEGSQHMMSQRLVGPLLAAAIIVLVLGAIAKDNFLLAGMFSILFFLIPTAGRLDLWWMGAFASLGSNLATGLPGDVKLNVLMMLGFVCLTIVAVSRAQRNFGRSSIPRKACLWLLIIIIITASYRGWGLKILDSTYWGGMQYVSLMAALLFYIFSNYVRITITHLKWMLICFFLLSLLPAVGVVISQFVPHGEIVQHVIDVGASETGRLSVGMDTPEVVRWGYMQYPAIWMGVLALLIYDRRFSFTPWVGVVAALSFMLLGMSGHRTVVVLLGLTLLTYLIIRRQSVRWNQFMKLLCVVITLVVVIYLFAEKLPLAFQRAFAWLPGIEVSYYAKIDALATTDWRIELWHHLVGMIPDYLWVGRGMAFSVADANSTFALASDQNTRYVYFTAVHLYHSGPLWFLLDLGVAGFIAGISFMLGGIVYYGRQVNRFVTGSLWRSVYGVFYSFFVGYCIFFYSVIGGSTFLIHILVVAAVLEVVLRSAELDETLPETGALM